VPNTDQGADGPTSAEDPRASDEVLRLVGLFVVNFAQYISSLEIGIWNSIHPALPTTNRILWSITGSMTAEDLRKQFFTATALMRDPTDEEERIRKALNKRGQRLTEARNDITHGTWFLSSTTGVETEQGLTQVTSYEPTLMRSKTSLGGHEHRTVISTRSQLEGWAQEAAEVASLLGAYSTGLYHAHLGLPTVTDRLGWNGETLVTLDLTDWAPGSNSA
jgi:hypothetical protein